MPCNYNPDTGEVETLYERYQREVLLDEILYQQYIAEKIDNLKEKIVITKEALTAAGYKPFTQRNIKQYTDSFWQKCIRDDKGKKYYITISEYDWSGYPDTMKITGNRYSYSPDCQFEANGVIFDIDMLSPESVEQMEKFFDDVWGKLGCEYYE